MNQFIQKYREDITATLSGFDRLVFKGSLRRLYFQEGITLFLNTAHVLLKDFAAFAGNLTHQVRAASVAEAHRLGRPVQYLPSSQSSKEEIARQIAARDNITEGLICVLSCVEMCHSFTVVSNPDTRRLELVPRPRKCLHLYHYYIHPVFGFMNARLQTWLPMNIQICINGREWLSRQLAQNNVGYERRDNCFVWTQDFSRAQALMDEQLKANWPELLNGIARSVNPAHEAVMEKFPTPLLLVRLRDGVGYRHRLLQPSDLAADLPDAGTAWDEYAG
jgi:hypothetical protein